MPTVKNIDQYRFMDEMKKSGCPLCKEALAAIKSYEQILKMNQRTLAKAIGKIKELSKDQINDNN